MKDFHMILPTFAPDYSGVCSTLFELEGLVVIHDAGGCTGTFTGYDEPRWFDEKSCVFTSGLDDVEAVFGTDHILLEKILSAQEALNRRFIALLGSPSPMVLGTDLEALSKIIEQKTGKKCLRFDTKGTLFYDEGISMALLALAGNFLPAKRPPIIPHSVNLIGATPLDLTNRYNIGVIRKLLEENGYSVRSTWAMGSTLDEISDCLSAQCNIVLTASALKTARYLENTYGMPYLAGSFSGVKGAWECLRELDVLIDGKKHSKYTPPGQAGGRTLIVGEQLLANGIRQALELDLNMGGIDVSTFFHADPRYMRPGDRGGIGEDELSEQIGSGAYDLVIGDGLYRLFDAKEKCRFVEVPHVAVSSRLGWESPACPYGEGLLGLVQHENEELCG